MSPLILEEGIAWNPTTQKLLALLFLAVVAYYFLARWLLRKCRPTGLRYWWPSAMVAAAALLVLSANLPLDFSLADASAALFLSGLYLNLPLLPVFFLDGILVDRLNLGGWSTDAVVAISIWTTWYVIIRVVEQRPSARY